MSLLDEVSSTLEAAGIRHALIGALALAVHGINRATVDLDLFVADATPGTSIPGRPHPRG